jgi:hypothetical protein
MSYTSITIESRQGNSQIDCEKGNTHAYEKRNGYIIIGRLIKPLPCHPRIFIACTSMPHLTLKLSVSHEGGGATVCSTCRGTLVTIPKYSVLPEQMQIL